MFLYVLGLLLALLAILYAAAKYVRRSCWSLFATPKETQRTNPVFNRDLIRNPPKQEVEFDTAKRDRVLKNSFTLDKVPRDLDAIIIGSGLGALAAASLLAKTGKKVLVLEQHDQAGGCCHVYEEKGFEFDVGIHYVGAPEGSHLRLISDQISDGKLKWERLEDAYDILAIGDSYERKFPLQSGKDVLMKSLIEKFPDEEAGIKKFFSLLKMSSGVSAASALLKTLPKPFCRFLIWSGLLKWAFPGVQYLKDTVSDVLNELVTDDELKAILGYSFGDYGTPPTESPFYMQATLTNHFSNGAFYPRGGASEIAYHIIPSIEAAGGRVLVRVKVTNILLNDAKNKVVGVQARKGKNEYNLFAPIVISDAGVINTYKRLLPPSIFPLTGMDKVLKKVKPGPGLFSVFIGLDGTGEELGLKPQNVWAFRSSKIDKMIQDYISLPSDEARMADVPLIFLSFPSTKDPTYNTRYPGKTTCVIITITPYEWFEEWKDGKIMHRGEEYHSLKMDIGRKMWQQVLELYPSLEDKLEYMEVGTPLSNQFYFNTSKGEVYGLDHNVNRFDPNVLLELRPETSVQGLFLTGQDVYSCGYGGAMTGGLLCAATILKRNLMLELQELKEFWKKETAKNK